MKDTLPPIVVSRVPRGPDWSEATSWFGGRPRLGSQAWPRSRSTGKPLVFAAQLDLASIAAANRKSPLPSEGSLAFFLEEGAVVHVPAGADRSPTNSPPGARPAFELCGDLFPEKPSPWARMVYPYWPVEFTALDLGTIAIDPEAEDDDPGEAVRAAMVESVRARFQMRQYFFTAKEAFKTLGDGAPPLWFHCSQAYAEHLKIARFHAPDIAKARLPYLERTRAEVERLTPKTRLGVFGKRAAAPDEALAKARQQLQTLETQDADFQRQLSGFDAFVTEADGFAAGRDPWARMTPGEIARFNDLFNRGRKDFADLVRYRTPHSVDDVATETLLAMATGEAAAFDAMPKPIRDLIAARYLLPTQAWHQMFGLGVDIQGNASAQNEDGNHLLLQLVYDDMVSWNFGDMGAFQFWISPQDLAAGNWNGVKLMFECH